MKKIQSFTDLKTLQDDLKAKNQITDKSTAIKVKVAMATCAIASGAKTIFDYFSQELDKRSIEANIIQTGCMGYCYAEPTIEITLPGKEPVVFGDVDIKRADLIIENYIKEGSFSEGIIPVNYQSID